MTYIIIFSITAFIIWFAFDIPLYQIIIYIIAILIAIIILELPLSLAYIFYLSSFFSLILSLEVTEKKIKLLFFSIFSFIIFSFFISFFNNIMLYHDDFGDISYIFTKELMNNILIFDRLMDLIIRIETISFILFSYIIWNIFLKGEKQKNIIIWLNLFFVISIDIFIYSIISKI